MIPLTQQTKAKHVDGWTFTLIPGLNPKLTMVCGNCNSLYKTRDYVRATNQRNEIVIFCPYCQYWNFTGLIYE